MRIGVCDDEKNIRELISNKIKKEYPNSEIVFFKSGEELLLESKDIDILLLDIQMPGRNGIEIARELRKKNNKTILIFVTAMEDYVFEAFDVNAFNYIVKPFNDNRFMDVLNKAINEYNSSGETEQETRYVMVSNKGMHTKVKLDEIIYAEVFNRKVVIHKTDEEIEYYGKMSELESLAGESFFRSHRAYLINFKYVEKYDAKTIYMEKGKVLMAKKNYPEFVKKYMKYNQRRGN